MIGVIGANGVAATNELLRLIEEAITGKGAFRDCHHPEMLVFQATQVPSRSMFLEGRGPSFIPQYTEIGKMMLNAGCTELCMCCNTAHFAVDELEKAIGLPFINVIDEALKKAVDSGARRIAVMCSDGCRKAGLYDKSLARICSGAEIVYPDSDFQKLVTKAICNSKNNNRYLPDDADESPVRCLNYVCSHLSGLNADCIVGGCTDLRAVYPEEKHNFTGKENIVYVDSLETLADEIVKRNQYFTESQN